MLIFLSKSYHDIFFLHFYLLSELIKIKIMLLDFLIISIVVVMSDN